MWLDASSQQSVDLFWERCGEPEPFPRALEQAVQFAFPVVVIKLPKLQLSQIETWFARRNTKYQFGCASRAVRGFNRLRQQYEILFLILFLCF
jgi:hypothetical protein